MKSIKNIRKTSYRRKFRNTRRTNRKTYKKVKRGGNPTIEDKIKNNISND